MFKRRALKTMFAAVISLTVLAVPVFANPGNGANGEGQGGNHQDSSGNHGNKGQGNAKSKGDHGHRKN